MSVRSYYKMYLHERISYEDLVRCLHHVMYPSHLPDSLALQEALRSVARSVRPAAEAIRVCFDLWVVYLTTSCATLWLLLELVTGVLGEILSLVFSEFGDFGEFGYSFGEFLGDFTETSPRFFTNN